MNRRKFTKSALGIIALAPFTDWNYVKPVFGVDKAIGEDQTEMVILEKPLSDRKFQEMKSSFLRMTVEGKVRYRYIPLL